MRTESKTDRNLSFAPDGWVTKNESPFLPFVAKRLISLGPQNDFPPEETSPAMNSL